MKRKGQSADIAVLASSQAKLPEDMVLATYSCKSCDAIFATNEGIEPFCIHCGSDEVGVQISDKVPELPKDEDSLSTIICPECGQHNIMSDTTAKVLAGVLSCVTCGSEIEYDFRPLVTASDDLDSETEDDADNEEFSENEEDDSDLGGDDIGDDTYIEDEEDSGANCKKSTASEDVSLLDVVSASNQESSPTLVRVNDKILAFVGDICVARLDDSVSYKHHDIFTSDKLTQSIEHSFTVNGVKETLASFEFKIPSIKVDSEAWQLHSAKKASEEARANVLKEAESLKSTIRQCLSIAAVGLNKGFWKDKTHVLKAELYKELCTLGMHNPTTLIDRVFANYSDKHHRTLFEIAFDLISKPADIRNSLAEAVSDVNYIVAAENDSDDSYTDGINEDRLEQSLRANPVHSSTVTGMDIPKGRLFAVGK